MHQQTNLPPSPQKCRRSKDTHTRRQQCLVRYQQTHPRASQQQCPQQHQLPHRQMYRQLLRPKGPLSTARLTLRLLGLRLRQRTPQQTVPQFDRPRGLPPQHHLQLRLRSVPQKPLPPRQLNTPLECQHRHQIPVFQRSFQPPRSRQQTPPMVTSSSGVEDVRHKSSRKLPCLRRSSLSL